MAEYSQRHRMDLIRTAFRNEKGELVEKIYPDPRRYEIVERRGEQWLHDKLDNLYISSEAFQDLLDQAEGPTMQREEDRTIVSAASYVDSRCQPIAERLDGMKPKPTFEDKSEHFLQSLAKDELGFAILSVDIVGSTKLATSAHGRSYAHLIATVLYELSEVVAGFNGHVLKYTGDGLIAYFSEPSFMIKNDLAIDCALTLRKLVYKALNPALEERGHPTIEVRIGLDAGGAFVVTMGSPKTKQHKDIIGSVVSLASKIQGIAEPGSIYLGQIAERNLHTMWREICEPAELDDKWNYKDTYGNVYKIYRVK